MNERIQQLAEQAKAESSQWLGSKPAITITHDELEKFAELIVRECVDICNRVYFDNYPDAEDFERSEEGDAIKKHFGVKA